MKGKETNEMNQENNEVVNVIVNEGGVEMTEVRIPPAHIAINPKFAALRGNRESKEYKDGIKRLANQLKEEGGQKQAVTIRFNTLTEGDQKSCSYELIAGHRRYDAAVAAGVDLIAKLEDMSDEEAMRWARRENWSREDFTPMEKARQIVQMRLEKMTTKQIAEELGASTATVTQMEKLLNAAPEVQQAVEEGKMTASAALEMSAVKPEKSQEVVKAAEKVAVAEAQVEVRKAEKKAKKTGKAKDVKRAAAAKEKVAKKKVKVEGKHVRAAVKKVKGATAEVKGKEKVGKAPQRAEIVAFFQKVRATSGPQMKALAGETLKWIAGKLGDRELLRAYHQVGNQKAAGKAAGKTVKAVAKKVPHHAARKAA